MGREIQNQKIKEKLQEKKSTNQRRTTHNKIIIITLISYITTKRGRWNSETRILKQLVVK